MYVHRSTAEPVTYGWYRDEQGWHFLVNVPRWVSPAEMGDLARWLEDYATTIRRARPLWVVQVRPSPNGFILDAYPSRDQGEFVEQLLRLAQENTYA